MAAVFLALFLGCTDLVRQGKIRKDFLSADPLSDLQLCVAHKGVPS